MKSFLWILVMWGILYEVHAINFGQILKELLPASWIANEKDSEKHEEEVGEKNLLPGMLKEIHAFAKNLSHSKGMIRKVGDKIEARRSVVRKATVASESVVLKGILTLFEQEDDKLLLLEDLEFLVHDYDIAIKFANLGGIKILSPYLFSEDSEIVTSVILVLGSAMQSNPVVQHLAMEEKIGRKLLSLLFHESPMVVSRAVFALSCFLRNAPDAQEEFISINGVARFAEVLNNDHISTPTKMKIIILFQDLVIEHEIKVLHHIGQSFAKAAALQRSFAYEIRRFDICECVVKLLNLNDYQTHERILSVMLSLSDICYEEFKTITKSLIFETYDKLLQLGASPSKGSTDSILRRALIVKLAILEGFANVTRRPPKDEL